MRLITRFGRALWRKGSGYHRRSRLETKMNCRTLLGQKLMSVRHQPRTDGGSRPPRQTVELQVRIAILNRFTAPGIPAIQPVGCGRRNSGGQAIGVTRLLELKR